VTEAMLLVDQRMYAQKTSARRSPDRQSRDVLLRALQERNPELAERHAAVARLAEAIAERMGLSNEDQAQLRQAAELHDVGKLAIPEELLHKPGPLDAEEWAFVRRHHAPQLTVPDAIDELRRCAGTQFDPTVVDGLANLVIGLAWPPEHSSIHTANSDRVGAAPERYVGTGALEP